MSLPTDHSKIAEKLVFNFHSDDGHGWLAVKKTLVRELGIIDKISSYSYMQGESVYLEEDCDLTLFVKAFESIFNIKPKIKHLQQRDGNSVIRSMKQFKMEV